MTRGGDSRLQPARRLANLEGMSAESVYARREPLGVECLESRTLLTGHTLATATLPTFHIVGDPTKPPQPEVAQASGRLANPSQVDVYRVNLTQGERLTAILEAVLMQFDLSDILFIVVVLGIAIAIINNSGGGGHRAPVRI